MRLNLVNFTAEPKVPSEVLPPSGGWLHPLTLAALFRLSLA